jgi:hypothetical protein
MNAPSGKSENAKALLPLQGARDEPDCQRSCVKIAYNHLIIKNFSCYLISIRMAGFERQLFESSSR